MGKAKSDGSAERNREARPKGSAVVPAKSASVLERKGTAEARAGQIAGKIGQGPRVIEKGKRGFVVRDSFTMPVADYELIGALKQRCLTLGIAMKKSELLRAGLSTLNRLSDESLTQVVAAIESVKTGRPPGGKRTNRPKRRKQ